MTAIPLMTSGLTPTTLTPCSYPPALIRGYIRPRQGTRAQRRAGAPTNTRNQHQTQGVIDRA